MELTENIEKIIEELSIKRYGYSKILYELNLLINAFKFYCQRNGLNGSGNNLYLNCGVIVEHNPKRKNKKFCSDKCRLNWCNNKEKINKTANYKIICVNSCKGSISYGNLNRKYCSYNCYIIHRFSGDNNE